MQSPAPVVAVYQRMITPYRMGFFRKLSTLLDAEGYRLIVFAASAPPDASGFDLRLVKTAFSREVKGRDIIETLVVPKGLGAALRALDPALIVTEDISALPGNLWATLLRLSRGTPYLIWSLGPAILGKRRSRLRWLAEPLIDFFRYRSSGFIAYSDWAAGALEAKYRRSAVTAPNSTVAASEVVDSPPARARKAGDPLRLLFVGRLAAQKRVDLLLRAMRRMRHSATLDIVGDGSEKQALETLARALGINGRVRFHGEVRDHQVKARLIDHADLAVLPGLGGLFIQEAQSRGLPVVAGPADGTEQDLIKAVSPELYLDEISEEGLAALLDQTAADRKIIDRAAHAVLGNIRERYNIDVMAVRWAGAALNAARSHRR